MRRLLLVFVGLGCAESTPPKEGPRQAASVQLVSGAGQVAIVHTDLPLAIVARIVDSTGKAVPNQLVNFVVVKGGGHVFAGSAISTLLGEVREHWTLGDTAGTQALEVRAVDQTTGAPIVYERVEARAEPAAVETLFVSVTDSTVFVGDKIGLSPIITRMRDRYGNDASSRPVSIATSAGWSRSNDTIWTTGERRGTATFMAGAVTRTVNLLARTDLRKSTWKVEYFCIGPRYLTSNFTSPYVDSAAVSIIADSVWYRGDPDYRPLSVNADFEFKREERQIRWFDTGIVDTLYASGVVAMKQRPDSLINFDGAGASLRVTGPALRYEGGNWCRPGPTESGGFPGFRAVSITANTK